MIKMFRFALLSFFLTWFSTTLPAQTVVQSDSSLREILTRAVQSWRNGKVREAYLALDTISGQPLSTENAATKVKAAIWTANFLQAQRKIKPAASFLDSALTWAEKSALGEELARTYEAYSDWHLSSGNPKTAIVAREAAWRIRDSLSRMATAHSLDSLQKVISLLNEQKNELVNERISDNDTVRQEASSWKKWFYILTAVCVALLIIVFLMNGTLQRLRHAPPAPAPSAPRTRQEPVVASPAIPPSTTVAEKKSTDKNTRQEIAVPPPAAPEPLRPLVPPAVSTKDITFKLQDVELVLIRAEILGKYNNGETKSVRNLLNEYMAQLPFIMKTLDEAITKNEADPILLSLEHLKQYLQAFGMQSTLKLILEIEEEAKTEKVSKLLSRVFQIRNHCRRAADEAKALLEKLS